ncbi:MAG: molybdenum cofactor biosynthesis protein MoaE [Anaerolineae bacterium]
MKVKVRLFARLREAAGVGVLEQELDEGATVEDLLEALHAGYPRLASLTARTVISVNQEFAAPGHMLHHGDEVAIFPPVSGGADAFRVTSDPITLDEVAAMVVQPHTGALATFAGVVRNVSGGKAVAYLEYEAYQEMAIAKMRQIADEARARWPQVVDIAIVQRIGHLDVGDVAVVIAVSSRHRDEGCFEACRYAIDRLKEIVPVWKKEVGPDGQEWVEGDYLPAPGD